MELKKILSGLSNRTLKKAGLLADEKVAQGKERMVICKACPRLEPVSITCKECGCYMKTKVLSTGAKCPLNKW